MKILNIAENYISEKPADHAGIFIHRQSLALKQIGCDIRVINAQPLFTRKTFSPHYPYQSEKDGIVINRPRFVYVPRFIKPGKTLDLLYSWAVLKSVNTFVEYWRPEIIVADWIVPCGFAGAQLSKSLNIPLILRARGGDVRILKKLIPRLASYYKEIGRLASMIFCMGYGLYEDLIQIKVFENQKLFVTSNGIDTNLFHPANRNERELARKLLEIPQEAQVWVFIGSWDTQKGSTVLAQILPKLLQQLPEVFFIIAGPIRDQNSFNVVRSIGNRIRFLGLVKSQEVVKCLHAADLFLLPSLAEGLPNSLLEAMACGVPSIASAVGGIPHLLVDGKNGLLIQPNNPSALETSILRCTNDSEFRGSLGQEAQRTIIEQGYNLDVIAEKMYGYFRDCVNSSNPENLKDYEFKAKDK